MFSEVDARYCYWSVSLDQQASTKTTFNSTFVRYRFLRLPFGMNLNQDVFQERMDKIAKQCPGTISIVDDVGVFERTEEERNATLHQLMQAAQKHGLIFNGDKYKSSSAWYSVQMVCTLTPPGLTTSEQLGNLHSVEHNDASRTDQE